MPALRQAAKRVQEVPRVSYLPADAGKRGQGSRDEEGKLVTKEAKTMSLSDPIADMLTRIRNAYRARRETVNIRASKICEGISQVLKAEGYISDYDRIDDGNQGILRVQLKYGPRGELVLVEIKRISTPGRRVYSGMDDLPRPLNGMGISIISTSMGVMSDRQCRQENVGGEVLCTVS
jgi:small subunit ribosomal protein S8